MRPVARAVAITTSRFTGIKREPRPGAAATIPVPAAAPRHRRPAASLQSWASESVAAAVRPARVAAAQSQARPKGWRHWQCRHLESWVMLYSTHAYSTHGCYIVSL